MPVVDELETARRCRELPDVHVTARVDRDEQIVRRNRDDTPRRAIEIERHLQRTGPRVHDLDLSTLGQKREIARLGTERPSFDAVDAFDAAHILAVLDPDQAEQRHGAIDLLGNHEIAAFHADRGRKQEFRLSLDPRRQCPCLR